MPESEFAPESEVLLQQVQVGVAYASSADSDQDLAGTYLWFGNIAD